MPLAVVHEAEAFKLVLSAQARRCGSDTFLKQTESHSRIPSPPIVYCKSNSEVVK